MLLTYVNATGYFDLACGSKEFAFTAKPFKMFMGRPIKIYTPGYFINDF